MSIGAANLFSRNIYREFFRPDCTARQESNVAKVASLLVKVGALLFILFLPTQYAVELQTLGGVWILETLPAVILGLYTRWFHRFGLAASRKPSPKLPTEGMPQRSIGAAIAARYLSFTVYLPYAPSVGTTAQRDVPLGKVVVTWAGARRPCWLACASPRRSTPIRAARA
jgi:SSS family solute:Na+ symporter